MRTGLLDEAAPSEGDVVVDCFHQEGLHDVRGADAIVSPELVGESSLVLEGGDDLSLSQLYERAITRR